MLTISIEFEKALEAELDRLLAKRIEEYCETNEFYERLDKAVKDEISTCNPFFSWEAGGPLRLFMSPRDSDVEGYIDIEKVMAEELANGDNENWHYILGRLEDMAQKLRDALSRNKRGD